MTHSELYQLGFSEKEAQVYSSLLRIGPAVASTLARLTQIKRTSMYDILNALLERTLINSFRQGPYTYFYIDDVNKIYLLEKEKLETAKLFIEKVRTQQNLNPGIQVYYYKGVEGYREMYEDILRTAPKELLGWMDLDQFYQGIPSDREETWTEERINKGIYVRLILQDTPLARAFQKKDRVSNRETRLIDRKTFGFSTTCFLYDSFLSFFDSGSEFTGIRIHNPELANMQRQIFEMNWKAFS